jgi:hypothetical protein
MGRTACTEPLCLYKGALYLYFWSRKGRAIPLATLCATTGPVMGLRYFYLITYLTFTFNGSCIKSPVLGDLLKPELSFFTPVYMA